MYKISLFSSLSEDKINELKELLNKFKGELILNRKNNFDFYIYDKVNDDIFYNSDVVISIDFNKNTDLENLYNKYPLIPLLILTQNKSKFDVYNYFIPVKYNDELTLKYILINLISLLQNKELISYSKGKFSLNNKVFYTCSNEYKNSIKDINTYEKVLKILIKCIVKGLKSPLYPYEIDVINSFNNLNFKNIININKNKKELVNEGKIDLSLKEKQIEYKLKIINDFINEDINNEDHEKLLMHIKDKIKTKIITVPYGKYKNALLISEDYYYLSLCQINIKRIKI